MALAVTWLLFSASSGVGVHTWGRLSPGEPENFPGVLAQVSRTPTLDNLSLLLAAYYSSTLFPAVPRPDEWEITVYCDEMCLE